MPMHAGTRHSVVETVLLSSNGGELRYRVRSADRAAAAADLWAVIAAHPPAPAGRLG